MRNLSWLLLVVAVGCQASTTGRLRDKYGTDESPPEREVRLRLVQFVRHFAGTVDLATDAVFEKTRDPQLRREAMRGKLDAVAVCQNAAFHPDPDAALIDVWVFVVQLRQYYETGDGKARLGELHAIPLAAARDLEAQVDALQKSIYADDRTAQIEEWAAAHPIRGRLYTRPSPAADLAKIAGDPDLSTIATVKSMEERLADLSERVAFYVEAMPRQMRWQMELFMGEMVDAQESRTALAEFSQMAKSVQTLATIEERLPAIFAREREAVTKDIRIETDRQREFMVKALATEREAVFKHVDEQRTKMFDAVDQQRTNTLEKLKAERELLIESVEQQTDKALEAMSEERKAILTGVDEQREATLKDTRQIMDDGLANMTEHTRGLIDHLFWRLFQAGAALIVLFFVVRLIYGRLTASS